MVAINNIVLASCNIIQRVGSRPMAVSFGFLLGAVLTKSAHLAFTTVDVMFRYHWATWWWACKAAYSFTP